MLLSPVCFLTLPPVRAQKPIGNITVGWTYLWADQGSGERSNLSGWFARPAINLVAGFSVFADFTNYYGSNSKGAVNSHGFTGGISEEFSPQAPIHPSIFVEGGDIRGFNAGDITNSPAFLTGVSLNIPFSKRLSLALTPAEYAFIATDNGVRHDYNAKVGMSLSF